MSPALSIVLNASLCNFLPSTIKFIYLWAFPFITNIKFQTFFNNSSIIKTQ